MERNRPSIKNSSNKSKEQLHPVKGLFVFQGYCHDPANLQEIPIILNNFEEYLKKPFEKKELFLEFAGLSFTGESRITEATRRLGFTYAMIDALVFSELGGKREPTQAEVEKRIHSINEAKSCDDILKNGLLRPEDIQTYFLNVGYDNLRKKYRFNVRYENHGLAHIKEYEVKKNTFDSLSSNADIFFEAGRYEEAMSNLKQAEAIMVEITSMRDVDNNRYVEEKLKKMSKEKNGGLIFAVFGVSHSEMANLLKSKIKHQLGIQIEVKNKNIIDDPGAKITNALSKSNVPQNEWYAQYLVQEKIIRDVANYCYRNGKIDAYLRNWITFYNTVIHVVENMSEESISETCKKRINGVRLFMDTPLSASARFLLE